MQGMVAAQGMVAVQGTVVELVVVVVLVGMFELWLFELVAVGLAESQLYLVAELRKHENV